MAFFVKLKRLTPFSIRDIAMKKVTKLSIIGLLLFTISCMSYRHLPQVAENGVANNPRATTLEYRVDGNAMFAGPTVIREEIAASAAFTKKLPTEVEPKTGYFLNVEIKQLSPSIAAVVFGYISYATLTILPFWSTEDGASLTYSFYKDGKRLAAKEYVINRGTFVWLGMLPFVWVNLITPSEEEAFRAATRDFMQQLPS